MPYWKPLTIFLAIAPIAYVLWSRAPGLYEQYFIMGGIGIGMGLGATAALLGAEMRERSELKKQDE